MSETIPNTNLTKKVRTRFAPSPTGYMHIGGMRTALFCWLFARRHGGTFILRIDDTDTERNMEEALIPILKAFEWLGLEWDEGPVYGDKIEPGPHAPYFQSQRSDKYHVALKKMLDSGKAYRDFDPPELAQQERQAAEKEKRQYISARRSLDLSLSEIQKKLAAGDPYVIRLLVPRDQKIIVDDLIRGRVEFDGALMPDPLIVRSNGTPLYNFASVVDDVDMEITHIIRSEEHLSNTPIQVLIFQTLGSFTPSFAHIPYVAAPGSKEKMSKRKLEQYRKNPHFKKLFDQGDAVFPRLGLGDTKGLDPVMVEYYEKIGYLPVGLLNALVRIGWSLDDKTEIFSLDDMIREFTLERVIKSPASFDPDKLQSYEHYWMNHQTKISKVLGVVHFLKQAGYISSDIDGDGENDFDEYGRPQIGRDLIHKIESILDAIGDRLLIFSDIIKYDEFFVTDDKLVYDDKAFEKRIRNETDAPMLLRKLAEQLNSLSSFDAVTVDNAVHQFVKESGIQINQIIHALRIAVTGKASGAGLFEAMAIIGKESCLKRIEITLGKLSL